MDNYAGKRRGIQKTACVLQYFRPSDPIMDKRQGKAFWKRPGAFIVSNNKMFLLDDDANLYIFELGSSGATLLSQYKILDGIEAWGPMALAGNYLIMRDSKNMVSLFIGKQEES